MRLYRVFKTRAKIIKLTCCFNNPDTFLMYKVERRI